MLFKEDVQRLLRRDDKGVPLPKQADSFYLVVADYMHQSANLLCRFRLEAESTPRVTSLLTKKGGVTSLDELKFLHRSS